MILRCWQRLAQGRLLFTVWRVLCAATCRRRRRPVPPHCVEAQGKHLGSDRTVSVTQMAMVRDRAIFDGGVWRGVIQYVRTLIAPTPWNQSNMPHSL